MASEHQLLLFWLQLLALLLTARALGGALRAIGQPAVIGELAAGLLLGPSVFGHLAPAAHDWLFPADPLQRALLAGPAWIGVFLLLILTGLETDPALIRRLGGAAARVALGSLVLPVLAGVGLGLALPEAFVGGATERVVFALFMGTALGISALPVIAKILSDLALMRRNVAQMLIAAAMANDLAGWILLGMVAGLAKSGSWSPRSRSASAPSTRSCAPCACAAGACRRTSRRCCWWRSRRAGPPTRSGSRRCSARSSPGSCSAARASTTPTCSTRSTALRARSSRRCSSPRRGCASTSACCAIPPCSAGAQRWWRWRASRRQAAPISARGSPRCPRARGSRSGSG
ncbi:MAG: hypothetical protein E6J87_12010 [Deltaproteobacteria bacterium]|nr:MAG: hypothetical protein E6J87_12010 [Deltaproteobacteria bacterium]